MLGVEGLTVRYGPQVALENATLRFEAEQFTAVIGPNGSGKSNVVEALRWATHQARARELRAGRGTELIFHGSGGKAPLGLAEVQVELHTPEGRVNLARRIYRDGSSEQDLNGRSVRVRDVHAALRGTGLGPGGLAVIGQGEVSGVVQAEGKTLLGYVQEAAGLSRAVTARQESEARLKEADAHLEQLRLVLAEREAAVARLERAARDARCSPACSRMIVDRRVGRPIISCACPEELASVRSMQTLSTWLKSSRVSGPV